jgi:hypothetical protein
LTSSPEVIAALLPDLAIPMPVIRAALRASSARAGESDPNPVQESP